MDPATYKIEAGFPLHVSRDFGQALAGTLQGGTPTIVTSDTFLGIAKDISVSPCITVLRQVNRKGNNYVRNDCIKEADLGWPLSTRRIIINVAQSTYNRNIS